MKYKSKAKYEGPCTYGVTRIIQATEKAIATSIGTFIKRDEKWVWCVDYDVRLFPIEKEVAK